MIYHISFYVLLLHASNNPCNQPIFWPSNIYKPGYASGESPAKRVFLYLLEDFEADEVSPVKKHLFINLHAVVSVLQIPLLNSV